MDQRPGVRNGGCVLSSRLIFLATRFSFSVRPGFLAADLRGDLSDMVGHLDQIIDLERAAAIRNPPMRFAVYRRFRYGSDMRRAMAIGSRSGYGPGVERNRLAELLDSLGHASTACRHALLDGARFVLWDASGPAEAMVPAYERRAALAVAAGTSMLGFPEALDALRAAGKQPVRVGTVTLAEPAYRFTVFLATDPESVVACLGIEGSA
jgi:hypothetical protein